MKVPKQVLRIWKKNSPHGVLVKIAKDTELDIRTVHRAIREGNCSPNTYEKINNYFEVRKNREQVFINTFKSDNDGN